ncbi:MAG: nitrite/sulfite reductase, partial [Dehalococcoidia bacterium]|nr:nitrite/sulfite reductase [Dehalococcoidia bacterium]
MAIQVEEQGIVPIIEEELQVFDASAKAFRIGEKDPIEFQQYRLREGVYGQRQADVQMIRVKLPGGIVSARQLEVLGEVARKYTPLDRGHITTRECIQYHHVPLEDSVLLKFSLARVGVTSREACGNTVRNVISCPLAGVCRDEVFDITPYMTAYVRYFIRKPFTQIMPRKFKSSFSPCASDCANAPYHDIGFVANVKDGKQGFAIYVGGGSSIMPRAAQVLYDFVSVDEYLRVSEAVLRIFNKSDELRKNRMMARIKVLVDRIGIDEFRKLVETELQEPWAKDAIAPEPYMIKNYEKTPSGPAPAATEPEDTSVEYLHWKETNAVPQRQDGYSTVYLKVPQGDLSSTQFEDLARLSRAFGNGFVRLDFEQDLVLRWVPNSKLTALWKELKAIDLAEAGVHEITDTVSCPGTDSCKLGITASMGANRAIRDRLIELDIVDPLVRQMHVKTSGCPNGCGRHHLGSIGFQGAAVKGADGHQVPAYEVYIGGQYDKSGEFRYAKRVSTKLPSKRVPDATERIIKYYQAERQEGEVFNAFVDRVGHPAFEKLLADLRDVSTPEENFSLYEDWDRQGFYVLERGEG